MNVIGLKCCHIVLTLVLLIVRFRFIKLLIISLFSYIVLMSELYFADLECVVLEFMLPNQ